MLRYLIELSKYVILFFMLIYVLESFFYLFKNNHVKKKRACIRQRIYLFAIQFLAYFTMCLRTGKIDYLFYYAFLQIVLFAILILFEMIYSGLEGSLLNHMVLLLSIGFIILTRLDFSKAVKQFVIACGALVMSLFVPYIIKKAKFLCRWQWLLSVMGIMLLGIVLVMGQVTHGSKISYTIAGITIQPSEFVKIIFVFAMAAFLGKKANFTKVAVSAVVAGIHVLLLVVSRDLGSAVIFFIGYLFMLLIATSNYLYFLLGLLSGAGASVVAYQLFAHVRVRVQAFVDPFSVIDNQGYQIAQSLFAISCGGFFGTGLFKGIPSDIPYVESDSIFSAICEEMGVVFGICVLLICLFSFFHFLQTALHLKNMYYKLIASGLGVMYVFQVFLTVGGGLKFIPLTGVTLPFVSYGGSSVLTSIIWFAIMQGIVLIDKEETLKDETSINESRMEDEYEDEYEEEYEEEFEYGIE